jgi:hypothetical protein
MAVVIVIVNRTSFGSVKKDRGTWNNVFANICEGFGIQMGGRGNFLVPFTFDNLYYTPRGQGRVATKMSI